jgi:hypothetical protein
MKGEIEDVVMEMDDLQKQKFQISKQLVPGEKI